MTDLETAIAEVKRISPPSSPWEAGDIGVGSSPVDYHIATILNAVASGDLITREASDARAEALLREAANVVDDHYAKGDMGNPGHWVLALFPDATAAYDRAVKAAREEERAYALALEQEMRDRAETPESPRMSTDNFDCLVLDGLSEAMRAMKKFPQPNYVISKIAEEAGEVVKAAIHCAEGRETYANLRGEMKQLIAMLYRLWIEGDRVHGLPSVSAALAQEVGQ